MLLVRATRFPLFLVVAAAVGCGSPDAKPAADSDRPAHSESAVASKTSESHNSSEETLDPTPAPAIDEDAPDVTSDEHPADSAVAETKDEEPTAAIPQRFVLFTPGGPLVVALMLSIEGHPHQVLLERLIDQVLEAADTDRDGRSTWDEVSNSPTFIYGLMGNQPLRGGQARAGVKQQYDVDRDGVVDRREVPRFVTANRGSGRGIVLSSSGFNHHRTRLDSPLRRLLDADRDGLLSADEIATAWRRIVSRDADDDRIVYLDDIKPTVASMTGVMSARPPSSRGTGPDVAMWLSSLTSWDSVLYALKELYTADGELSGESFPLLPQLFPQLDGDDNGRLTMREVAALGEMRPHVVLFARFGGESNESATAVRLDWLTDELTGAGASVLDDDRSVSIDVSGVEVDFFVGDQTSGTDYQATARARLEALDTDSNGYLDTEEFSAAMMQFMAPFEVVDQDRDQKIHLVEITSFMKQKQASARSQIVIAAGPVEDALFSALDSDDDARLDERELAEVGRRLNALDADLDGQVSVDEIPLKLSVRIIRGLPQMGQAQYARPPAAPNAPAADMPRWFVRMDANGDGAISRREFLGTSEQFEELDLDDDDFVESDEAQQPPASR